MKKMLVLMVAVMMATMSANAQNGYGNTKHEVGVSYGVLSNSQWLNVFVVAMNNMFDNLDPVSGSVIGPVSAEYFYHANEWLGVGAIFSYGRASTKYNSKTGNSEVYTKINSNYTLMPAVKFNWLRRPHFGMYSKLGAGVMLYDMEVVPVDPTEKTNKEHIVGFNFQASALGIEFGGTQFRGFVEGGIGEQGVVLAGLRYKF